jgi:Domain of unknown function (DUF4136)
MRKAESTIVTLAAATAIALTLHVTLEGVDVRVDHDKTFDFRPVRTWAWNPEGAGEVKMARTQDDDPEAMKRKAEPWILDAVMTEMTRRGLQKAVSEPDLTLTYYLLLTTTMSAQTMGQFLPPVAAWGLPPFAQATQSLKMMNQGALVLDLSAKGMVVWRGVAEAKIAFDADDRKREALLREGVRDLLRRYPPNR